MKLKWKSKYNDTYITTKAKKNNNEIIADINKQWDYYTLWFCKPSEKRWIEIIKDIDEKFYDLEKCKMYAECFIIWYLSY